MGDVRHLDPVRPAPRAPEAIAALDPRNLAARRYVRRAEEALALLPVLARPDERAAICRITETWLFLAEAELTRRPDPR